MEITVIRQIGPTPDVSTNHKLIREMVNQKCTAAVKEVSSHALDQNRVDRLNFAVGIFTNLYSRSLGLSPYHGTLFPIEKEAVF